MYYNCLQTSNVCALIKLPLTDPPLRLQPRSPWDSHSSWTSDCTRPQSMGPYCMQLHVIIEGGMLVQLWNKFGKPDSCLACIYSLCTLILSDTPAQFWNILASKTTIQLNYPLCTLTLSSTHGILSYSPIYFAPLSSSAVGGWGQFNFYPVCSDLILYTF